MDYKEKYEEALDRAKAGKPMDEVFPELKENEDERIVEEIKYVLQSCCADGYYSLSTSDYNKYLAWLEKQKEQKPESCDCSRDEESYTNGIHHVLMNPEAYGLIKQKPAEWSEEDLRIISGIQLILELWDRRHKLPNGIRSVVPEYISWLKSLRPRPHWKPSEEQMRAVFDASERNDKLGFVLRNLYNDLKKL